MDPLGPFASVPLESGCFLIASPRLTEPSFRRTVVLLCAYGEEGAYGLILNRPTSMSLADIESDEGLLARRDDSLWVGGPVQQETLQILHRLDPEIPDALHVVDDVYLGGDPATLKALTQDLEAGDNRVRFVLGYSGWGKGQLESEIMTGSWIVCPASADLIFDARPQSLWRRALRALGGPLARLADEPPDPSWN